MTNNQLPMTKQEDNNQIPITKRIITREEPAAVSLFFWLLVIICFFGHWNLVIGHYPFRQTTEGTNLVLEQGL